MMIASASTSDFIQKSIQIGNNICRVSKIALPLLLAYSLPQASAGIVSYTACVATCPAMAAAAPLGFFQYTFETCISTCHWMLSPTCP
jgi:hypothetical protein